MSLFDLDPRREDPQGGNGEPVQDNPLLAFGSEGEQDKLGLWKSAEAKTLASRLAGMTWRADQSDDIPASLQAAPPASPFQRLLIPGLLSACVLVATAIYTEPIYNPPSPPEVAHPLQADPLIRPIPAPPIRTTSPATKATATPPAAPLPSRAAASPPQPAVGRAQAAVGTARTPGGRGQTPISPGRAPINRASAPAAQPPAAQSAQAAPAGGVKPVGRPGFGSLSINARPWADIWIDGQSAGQTPIANIPLRVGSHEIMFRHPQLGERRQTVQVDGVNPARIAVDLRN